MRHMYIPYNILLKEKLGHIYNFKSLFEQKLIRIWQHHTKLLTGARGKIVTEKRWKQNKEII